MKHRAAKKHEDATLREIYTQWNGGLSARQIAARNGISRDSVLVIVHRARRRGVTLRRREMPSHHERADGRGSAPSGILSISRIVGWTDLGPPPKTCQWIEAEPARADSPKCGKKVQPGYSYCPEHKARCWYARPVGAPVLKGAP